MSRMKIEKNIAWDDVKKKYYVTLYFGKDDSGAIIKKTVTTTNKKEAQSMLREHNKKMEDRVYIFHLVAAVEHGAYDIGHTLAHYPQESR